MEELIRHILKEETNGSVLNTKGIDLVIKFLKKSYPYIIDWKLGQENRFTIYLHIICDIEKLKEFYGSDLKNYYSRHKEDLYDDRLAYAPSALKISETMDENEKHKDYIEMRQEINELYQMLPDHLIKKDEYGDPIELDPDKFMYR